MPRQFEGYEPDQLDCNSLSIALSVDFGMMPEVKTTYSGDLVTVTCKCRILATDPDGPVIVQAITRIPLKTRKSLYVMHYTVMLDCWHQLDRGTLAASARPIERGWNGRPQTPRRRT
jgi:hypothetical protein